MRRVGLAIGLTLAGAITASVLLVLHATRNTVLGVQHEWLTAAAFALILLPLGVWIGRGFDRLKQLSENDSLTGLLNRGFVERCYPKLVRQAEIRKKRISVTLIDLNDFKCINDSYGHSAGDQALRLLALTLQACARRGEIVARWGGDEFLLLCPYADEEQSGAFKRRVEEALDQAHELALRLDGERLKLSVGRAVYPDDGRALAVLVATADERLYEDKRRSKLLIIPDRLKA